MLLVIHNLPLNTRFGDVKSLLLEKCGLRDLILDKLIFEDNAMKITVGLPTEEDAALLVRKINGLYLKGHQLYVQDLRQKPSEQPYRLPKPSTRRDDNEQQNWNSNQQQGWNNTPQQSWNNTPQQSWDNTPQHSWNNNQQQNWNSNQQQSWNNSSQQNWKNPVHNQNNESQRNSNPFLYEQQNQNVQGGYGQELATAAAMWAQQAQQVNAVYDNQSVHYSQNVQYSQQFGQVDNQGYRGCDQGYQGFEQGGGDYTNTNTSWGASTVLPQPRGRSKETRKFNDARRFQPDGSFKQDSRGHSRQYSQPREERFERPQDRNKRHWEESERRDDDWRQRPASPSSEFRQHYRGGDKGAPQRSGSNTRIEPWIDARRLKFQPSNPMFAAPKPKFDPQLKFNKKQKFNAPNQSFNAPNQKFNAFKPKFNTFKPKFNPRNPKPNAPNRSRFDPNKPKLHEIPWDKLTEKQQQKIIKRNEFTRSKTVHRITYDIFNDLGLSQDDIDLKKYFTDPVRSRLDKVLGDERFVRFDMMYAKYLDAYNDDKHKILEEAKQLQRDGVEPKLQKLLIKPVVVMDHPSTESGATSNEPQAKRFKADGVGTGPRPGPSKPVSGKIPSYVDGDKQRFKAIKQQNLKDMQTLRCPDVGPELEKIVDEEVVAIANIFYKVIENTPDVTQKTFLQGRASEECIDDFKKMFKQKICQRLTNEGSKIVRIYAFTGKPPKKAELEPFMRQYGVLALKKSDRKPFFTAHLDSYKTLDELCNMGNVQIGNSDVIFKPLHMTPKYKRIHISSLKKMRDNYVTSQIKKPEVNILEKDWEIKLAAIKEKEGILKQENAAQDAAKQEILTEDEAVQDATKKETEIKVENGNVEPENGNVEPENGNEKPENVKVKSENVDVKQENVDVKSENDNVELENGNEPENPNTDVHTDKYGELHSNFDVIDEVQGSDTENDPKNNATDYLNDEVLRKSDESILAQLPIGSKLEIIFDDADSGDDDQVNIEEDIDLDDIDEDDLEDY